MYSDRVDSGPRQTGGDPSLVTALIQPRAPEYGQLDELGSDAASRDRAVRGRAGAGIGCKLARETMRGVREAMESVHA